MKEARWKNYPKEWHSWSAMRNRCTNLNASMYYRYGGRGIKVCNRWENSFANFLNDMGARPSSKHQLDRIDNDGNYEPGNCRWATKKQQMRNRCNTKRLTYAGETLSLPEWAERIGMNTDLLRRRISREWDMEQALFTKYKTRIKCRKITHDGKTLSIAEWSRLLGLKRVTINKRLRSGVTIAQALSTNVSINPHKFDCHIKK